MHVPRGRPEHPVFVKIRFAHAQDIAGGLECRKVGVFISRVANDEQDVDDGLGCQTGNGR